MSFINAASFSVWLKWATFGYTPRLSCMHRMPPPSSYTVESCRSITL